MVRQTLVAALLCVALPAAAADVRFDGSYRLRLNDDTNQTLDETGFATGQRNYLSHRLRLTPKIIEMDEKGSGIEVQASFDLVGGIFAGDVAQDFRGFGDVNLSQRNGFSGNGFQFRHLFTQIRFPTGVVQLGQMPADWGMGMLINSGEGENVTDFGDPGFGDIVERLLFATRPFGRFFGPGSSLGRSLAVAVGADVIYSDRYAQLIIPNGGGLQWGDAALEALAALIYDPGDKTRAEFYVSRRVQNYAEGQGDLHFWTFDAHFRYADAVSALDGTVLSVEGEAAELYGGTSHAANLGAPGAARISQQGAVLRVLAARSAVEAEVEGGYASGDANPFDDQSNQFQMSRDYKVGLVLFDRVLLFQSQNAARRLSDPALFGRPPPGLDFLPTEGAVANALYLKPTLRWKPRLGANSFRFVASVLFAHAPEPLVDPYHFFISSSAQNSFGRAAGQNYGIELDGAAGYSARLFDQFGLETGIQFGYLLPGNAFTTQTGARMPAQRALRLRATITF
ncbi:MAG TPA: hypothetical protein VGH20_03390 [Myxococcales bacterium]